MEPHNDAPGEQTNADRGADVQMGCRRAAGLKFHDKCRGVSPWRVLASPPHLRHTIVLAPRQHGKIDGGSIGVDDREVAKTTINKITETKLGSSRGKNERDCAGNGVPLRII